MLSDHQTYRPIAYWLFFCAFMVAMMVWIGGVTRLTESGLSIVEWKPVTGTLPPLSESAWQEEFTKYRQTPEYHKKNFDMDLEGFKKIFFLEYLHRLIGRLVGVVFFVPFFGFLLMGKISIPLAKRLAIIFLLGGAQGALGWYMVKSGLVNEPSVSQYRLAAHLGMAFILFALLFRTGLKCLDSIKIDERRVNTPATNANLTLLTVIMIQVISGAFVAGLDAGLVYNTFPLMGEKLIPDGLMILSPMYLNFLENPTAVQFFHRCSALITLLSVVRFWYFIQYENDKISPKLRPSAYKASHWLLITVVIQMCLGIATLLLHVPVVLASLHQMGALALFAITLYIRHAMLHTTVSHGT